MIHMNCDTRNTREILMNYDTYMTKNGIFIEIQRMKICG